MISTQPTDQLAFSKTKAIAILKFNQQGDSDRTFKSPSDRTFKNQSDRIFKNQNDHSLKFNQQDDGDRTSVLSTPMQC